MLCSKLFYRGQDKFLLGWISDVEPRLVIPVIKLLDRQLPYVSESNILVFNWNMKTRSSTNYIPWIWITLQKNLQIWSSLRNIIYLYLETCSSLVTLWCFGRTYRHLLQGQNYNKQAISKKQTAIKHSYLFFTCIALNFDYEDDGGTFLPNASVFVWHYTVTAHKMALVTAAAVRASYPT